MPFKRGEIYRCSFGAGKERPVVIVSRDTLNGGQNVIVVPFTTVKLDQRRSYRSCVFFPAGTSGLDRDCVAKTDEITLIDKLRIDPNKFVGAVSDTKMSEVSLAIRWVVQDENLF